MNPEQGESVTDSPQPKRSVHLLIDSVHLSELSKPEPVPLSGWKLLTSMLEILAKLLPAVVLLVAIVVFKVEIADFLRHASKVEAFGFKLEKSTFAPRLEESAKKLNGQIPGSELTEVAFRKLKLAGPTLVGLRLLWVDDHPENNFNLRRILDDLGVHITIALNNDEGLNAVKRNDFDVIISDFGRGAPPSENGGDLAKKLVELGYKVPFLIYTADPANVSADVPRALATNDPALLLSEVAEIAIARH